MPAEIVLIRHGRTGWSAGGRHTGLTDVPLTAAGEEQARSLGRALAGQKFALILTSPRQRARRTAELAGLHPAEVEEDLAEWDYGAFEGLTTPEISSQVGHPWRVFEHGVRPGRTPGESLHDVAGRADRVLARARPVLEQGDQVALVGHGHHLRVLAARWLGLQPAAGASLVLAAGTVGRLGFEHGVPAVVLWNSWCDQHVD